jgi:deoxyribose-phosphate aldolase
MSEPSIARRIDISTVRAQHGEADVRALAEAARAGGFVNAHVLPAWVTLARELLDGSETLVGAPIGFPSGGHATAIKVAEAQQLLADGAQELDVVINVGRLRSRRDDEVLAELSAVRAVVPPDVPLKAILEVALLDGAEVDRGARIAVEAGVDYVKTGTGWTGVPVTLDDVRTIRAAVGDRAKIKASGGLRDLDTVLAFEAEGVERFGIAIEPALAIVADEAARRAEASR